MEDQSVKKFVLDLLQVAGAAVQPEMGENAYRCTIPRALASFFPRQTAFYFTFDPDVYDLCQEAGIEYVAPGYPLLDGLIRFARARLLVTQSTAEGHPLKILGLSSQSLELTSHSHDEYQPYVCFHFKMTIRSDEPTEEIFPLWVDLKHRKVLQVSPEFVLSADTPSRAVDKRDVQEVWDLLRRELESTVRQRTAHYEEAASLRLEALLKRSPVSQHRELQNRARLEVETELVFAEVVHAPLQVWEVKLKARRWQKYLHLEWDSVRKRWQEPPLCPICHRSTPRLEGWDAGRHEVCPACLARCNSCGAGHCADHPATPCTQCAVGLCESCTEHCDLCHKPFCKDCLEVCPECGRAICTSCSASCSICGHLACPEHFTKCHLSGALMCQKHVRTCSGCGKPTHPSRLHPIGGRESLFCEACAIECSQPHDGSRWIPRREAVLCSGAHSTPNALCAHHARRCSLHGSPAAFCAQHLHACASCGAEVCAEHGGASAVSGRHYCRQHLTSCPSCRKTVGLSELISVAGGRVVCPECALSCAHCVSERNLWPMSELAVCSFCVQESGTKTTYHSLDELKRHNPGARVCPEHRGACHVCNRQVCTDHFWRCPECGGLTCPDHRVMTREGREVCNACVRNCIDCGPSIYHLASAVQACGVCGHLVCAGHSHTCESCLQAACSRHLATCVICGGSHCARCSPKGVCPTCQALAPSNLNQARLPTASLPFSARPQPSSIVVAYSDRKDGTLRIHIGYYEEPAQSTWLLSLLSPPRARLDVFEFKVSTGAQLVRSMNTPVVAALLPPYRVLDRVRDWLRRR